MVEYQELGDLRLVRKVNLQSFNAVIAFGGWPDAKRVATYSAEYLIAGLKAERIGEIDSTAYYDFVIQRPLVSIEKGLIKEYRLPRSELYTFISKTSSSNLLVLVGEDPHTNWFRYVESVLRILELGKLNRICLLGGLIDRIPHTIEPLVSGVATAPQLVEEMKLHGIEPTDYVGPSGIHSLMISECTRRGVSALSLWGHTPSYIKDVDAQTAYQLLCKVKAIVGLDIDLEDVRQEGNLLRKQLDAAMEQDQSFSEAVRQLEFEFKVPEENRNT
jgi:proteasome assembly chaperone (PAC2) family protein